MAHFAHLDEHNVVTRVVIVSNDDMTDDNGNEVEALGVAVCESIVGPGSWVQTSINNSFRKQYGGVGSTYDADADVFIAPKPEAFPSWVLNADYDWEPPIAEPSEGGPYRWNEETQTWDQVVIPAEEPAP